MRRSLTALLALCLTTSCATSRDKPLPVTAAIEHVQVPVLPPPELLADCTSMPSDGTIGGELKRLADLVRCEWDRNAALRTWAAKAGAP